MTKPPGPRTAGQISASPRNKTGFIAALKDRPPARAAGLFSLFSLALAGSACSVATTRPVQEMAIADSALRAAREVNADAIEGSNIPEIYRAAADNLFKAKREYRLKNFDRAKKYATRATVLAERAEFEAVKAGGATPEAAAARANWSMEGAMPDPDLGLNKSIDTGPDLAEPHNPPTPSPLRRTEEPEEEAIAVSELESQEQKQTSSPENKAGAPSTPSPSSPPPAGAEP